MSSEYSEIGREDMAKCSNVFRIWIRVQIKSMFRKKPIVR